MEKRYICIMNRQTPLPYLSVIMVILLIFSSPQLVFSINHPMTYIDFATHNNSPLQLDDNGENCTVPCGFILDVLKPDSIPSIDNPKFVTRDQVSDTMDDEDIVLGIVVNGIPQAFPLDILDWHEVVNADVGGRKIALTYCPLTATGISYDRDSIGGGEIGVSGKLYENNLVFYDRDTAQYWLQMYGEVIQGDSDQLGKSITRLPITETTWRAWRSMYPDTQVLSRDTGIYNSAQYSRTAYPGYDQREDTLFRSSYDETSYPDNLYSRKNRTLIITHQNITKLYPYQVLASYSVIIDEIAGQDLLVVFDELNRLAIPFNTTLESGVSLKNFRQASITHINNQSYDLPVFTDESSTLWNFKGEAMTGKFMGQKLAQFPAYTGYWFAAMAMYPNASIFPENAATPPVSNTVDWANRLSQSSNSNITSTLLLIGFGVILLIGILVVLKIATDRRSK